MAKFGGSNYTERAAQTVFEAPRGVCVSESDLYVADSTSGVVSRVFTLENVYGTASRAKCCLLWVVLSRILKSYELR
jgi:hypothetical protein